MERYKNRRKLSSAKIWISTKHKIHTFYHQHRKTNAAAMLFHSPQTVSCQHRNKTEKRWKPQIPYRMLPPEWLIHIWIAKKCIGPELSPLHVQTYRNGIQPDIGQWQEQPVIQILLFCSEIPTSV
jgi:hypothetical protein